MKILTLTTEQRFYKNGNKVYVIGDEDYSFWKRYLNVFDTVFVIGRLVEVANVPPKSKVSSGDRVNFIGLQDYQGLGGIIRDLTKVFFKIKSTINASNHSTYLLRIPGLIGYLTWLILFSKRKNYAIELVADPYEESSSAGNIVSKVLAPLIVLITKFICKNASEVSYVTQEVLQKKYPSRSKVNYSYSSLDLKIDHKRFNAYSETLNEKPNYLNRPKLILIGRMNKPFKGVDTALQMMNHSKKSSVSPELHLIGGGALLEHYKKYAHKLDIIKDCVFHGEVTTKKDVIDLIFQSDIMILPSRREGLPRALIEGMSVGVPIIASNVAGIPELLPEELLIKPNDSKKLFDLVIKLSIDKDLRKKHSKINFKKSLFYDVTNLTKIRTSFYQAISSI